MSRYIDLDGLTWDGKPISSKIQEVKTKSGYLQGITVGWLWGDNVPHIDLSEHDKQIRDEVISEIINKINHIGYVPVCVDCFTRHNLIEMLEHMKGEQNE